MHTGGGGGAGGTHSFGGGDEEPNMRCIGTRRFKTWVVGGYGKSRTRTGPANPNCVAVEHLLVENFIGLS